MLVQTLLVQLSVVQALESSQAVDPQSILVLAIPQLSLALTRPQFFPSLEQKVGSDSGVQLETQVPVIPQL